MADQTLPQPSSTQPAAPSAAGFDVLGAQRAGYSPAEIADYLASKSNFDIKGARDAGYNDSAIIDHLTPSAETQSSLSKTMPLPTGDEVAGGQPPEPSNGPVDKVLGAGPEVLYGAVTGAGQAIKEADQHPEEVEPSDDASNPDNLKWLLGKVGLAPTEQNSNLVNRATWALTKAGITGLNLVGTTITGAVHGGAGGAAKALTDAGMEPQSAQDLARDVAGGIDIEMMRGGEVPAVTRLHGSVKAALGDNLRGAVEAAPDIEKTAEPVMAAGNLDDAIAAASKESEGESAPDLTVSETPPEEITSEGNEASELGPESASEEITPKPRRFEDIAREAAQHLDNARAALEALGDAGKEPLPEEPDLTPTESAQEPQPAPTPTGGATETPTQAGTPAPAPENAPAAALSPEEEAHLRNEPLGAALTGGSFARREGEAEPAPPFFSALTQVVESAKQEKAAPGQWLAQIKNTPGIKGEELEWSGVEDWLKGQAKSVTKSDLLDYLRANEVQVNEVERSAAPLTRFEARERNGIWWTYDTEKKRWVDDHFDRDSAEEYARGLNSDTGPGTNPTKFQQYTLPGGQNYRELLLTLPEGGAAERAEEARAARARVDATVAYKRAMEEIGNHDDPRVVEAKERWLGAADAHEAAEKRVQNLPKGFRESHWDEPNVLAHVRFDDRTGPNGEKILHVAEVQSDWHQKGRKQGYASEREALLKDVIAKEKASIVAHQLDRPDKAERLAEYHAANAKLEAFERNGKAVPDAPFKTTWPELAMKRMLRYAAEHGYDRLSWDTGETNAARYDLSKHVKDVGYERRGDKFNITVWDKQGHAILNNQSADAEWIENHLGKELAQKIIDGGGQQRDPKRPFKYLSGLDIKVGGEGMRGFYDRILPQFMNKYAKKWGAKVEDTYVPVYDAKNVVSGAQPAHSVEITPAMRDSIMRGQPLFARRAPQAEPDLVQHEQARLAFTPEFEAQRQALGQRLQDELNRRGLGQVAGRAADYILTPENHLADGHYFGKIIHVALDAENPMANLDHEVVHALKDMGLFTKSEWAILENEARRNWMSQYRDKLTGYQPHERLEESIAFAAQDHGAGAPVSTFAQRMFARMRDFFEATRNFFKGNGFDTADRILARTKTDAFGQRLAEREGAEPTARGALARRGSGPTKSDIRDIMRRYIDGRLDHEEANRELGADVIQEGEEFGYGERWDSSSASDLKGATEEIVRRLKGRQSPEGGSFGRRVITGAGHETNQYTPEQLRAYENVGRITEEPTWGERWQAFKADIGRRFIRATLDPYIGLKSLDPLVYMAVRVANTSAGAVEQFLTDGTIKFKGAAYAMANRNGGLQQLIRGLHGEETRFIWWVAAHRAEVLAKDDRENLWSPDDIKAIKTTNQGPLDFDYKLQNGQTTRSREAAYMDSLKKLDEFNRNLLDLAVEAGLTRRETASALVRNPFYVPFYRVADEQGAGHFAGPTTSSGFVRQYAFKQLTGGGNKLRNDLWTNYIGNASHIIDAAARNRAAVTALDAGRKAGAVQMISATQFDHLSKADKKNAVWVMAQGQKVHALITDSMLHTAISALEFTGYNDPVMRGLGWFKKIATTTITANPLFTFRVAIKDAMQTAATAPVSYNLFKNIVQGYRMNDLPTALENVARAVAGRQLEGHRMSDEAADAIAGGALMRLGSGHESGIRKTSLQAMGGMLDTPDKLNSFWHYISTVARAYKEVTAQGEDVNRLALYHKLIAEGVPHDQATFAGRDIEDFTLKGASAPVRILTQTVPFMNAWMQGLYKVGRSAADADHAVTPAIAGSAAKRVAVVLTAATLATLALDQIYKDDEDYKKRTDYDRDTYFWFKFGNTQIRVPMGFEVAALSRIAANGAEAFFGQNEMTARRFGNTLLQILGTNLAMNPTPQAVAPMLDVLENQSSAGVPIETKGMENLQPEDRYTSATSLPSRWISEAGAPVARAIAGPQAGFLSPVQIDYLVNGYFGWLGTMIMAVADRAARQFSNEPARPTRDLFAVASGGLVQTEPGAQSYYIDQLYRQADGIDKAYGTFEDLVRRGRTDEAQKFAAANSDAIGKHGLVNSLALTEAAINRDIRIIENSTDRTPQEKHDEIARLNATRNQAAEQVFGAHP